MLFLVWLFTAGFTEPSGFKGIPWGASIEAVRKVYPKGKKETGHRFPAYDVGKITLGNIRDASITFLFVDGGLEYVLVSFDDVITFNEAMEAALKAEYGPPTKRDADGDPRFNGGTLWWVGKNVTVSFQFYRPPPYGLAHVTIQTKKYIDAWNAAVAKERRKIGESVRKDLFK